MKMYSSVPDLLPAHCVIQMDWFTKLSKLYNLHNCINSTSHSLSHWYCPAAMFYLKWILQFCYSLQPFSSASKYFFSFLPISHRTI